MRKTILTLLLAAMSIGAMAESVATPARAAQWIKYGGNNTGTSYIDFNSIRKVGDSVKVWELQDLKERHKDGEMSVRVFIEYDCKDMRRRALSLITYSEPMTDGKVLVSEEGSTKWSHIQPNTPYSMVAESLCAMALVETPAWTGWFEMGKTDKVVFYIDPVTIRKDGNFRRVWEVQDLKERSKDGGMSRRYLSEYDCKDGQVRILSLSEHSEPKLGGKTLLSDDKPSKWAAVPPNTAAEDTLKTICAK